MAADLSRATSVEVDLRNLAEAPLELRGRVLEVDPNNTNAVEKLKTLRKQ
jgi:hypothetical protein